MVHEVKLVILGSGGVGKSALNVQFVQHIFVEKYDPTIDDGGYRKQIEVDGEQYLLEILDTQGDEQFAAMRDLYMKNGQGFLFVYSITAQSTFNDLPDVVEQVLRVKDVESPDEVPMVFCGNKCDLEDQRVIETRYGEELARRYGDAGFFETSAKTRINVDEAFYDLVRRVMAKRKPPPTKKELKKRRAAEKEAQKAQAARAKEAEKAQAAREKDARRTAAVDAARPQEIPETFLPRLPTRAQMGSDLRQLFERANTGAVGDERTCDIEFIFPLSTTGGTAAVNDSSGSGSDTDEAAGGTVGGTAILRAHKVVVLAHGGGMLQQVYAGAAPADARGVSKVYMNPDKGDISLQACRHLLSFVYSGELPAAGVDNADDNTDDNDTGSLWGSWKPFAKELKDAAARYDMARLDAALKGHGGGIGDGAASLNVMRDAEFLADVEFNLRDETQSSKNASASKKKGGSDGNIVIPSHQAVLRARSPYFESMFSDERFREGAHAASAAAAESPVEPDSRVSIPMDLADCCEGALRRGLAYLYEEHDASLENELILLSSGMASPAAVSTDDNEDASRVVMDLWRLARRWEVERLCLVVERVLARSLTNDTVCFFALEAAPADTSTGRPELLSSCIDYVSYRYDSVSQGGAGFAELPEDVRAKMQSARRPGIWDDPEAGGGVKLKKRFGCSKRLFSLTEGLFRSVFKKSASVRVVEPLQTTLCNH